MKLLITVSLLLFSFCSFGQALDTANMIRYDEKVWVTNPVREFIPINRLPKEVQIGLWRDLIRQAGMRVKYQIKYDAKLADSSLYKLIMK